LLSALLLQVFYGVRSERQLMEQLDYNLLYRWFVGLSPDDPVWDPTVFTKNRDRLQNGEVFAKFMSKLLNHPQVKPLLSDEHFSVDGTLIEAWASQKSFRPKDGSGDAGGGTNFHGQQRKNERMRARPIPTAAFTARRPVGRRSFAIWDTPPWRTGMGWRWPAWSRSPTGRPSAAPRRRCSRPKPKRPAAASRWAKDKAYDTADHVAKLRAINVTPHVTQNDSITSTGKRRRSAIDAAPRGTKATACRNRTGR
jgi:hypothetical protein